MEDIQECVAESRFPQQVRQQSIDAARDAWRYYNLHIVRDNNPRAIATAISVIGTIIAMTTSVVSMTTQISSRTSPPAQILKLKIHNRTPHPLALVRTSQSNSNNWTTPIIMSGQSTEVPFIVNPQQNLASRPTVTLRLCDEHGTNIRDITITIGRGTTTTSLPQVISTEFSGQNTLHSQSPNETLLQFSTNYFRGTPQNGMTPTVISTKVPNSPFGSTLDVMILGAPS